MPETRSFAAPTPRWRFVRVALPFLAGYFVSYVYRTANAVLAPTLASEFGLTPSGLGLMTGIYFFAFAVFQLPLGVLLDRYGPRRVNATLLLLAAAGAAWFAAAHSEASLVAARALIGIGVSGCLMASFLAFVLWYPAERIASMNALGLATGALGAVAATVPLELLLRLLGWREVFLCFAAVTVAVSAVLWLWVPERRAAPRHEELGAQLRGLWRVARDAAFWRVALCLGASQLAVVSLSTLWLATWLRDVAGYAPDAVARGLLAVYVAMILGYLGFGRAADAFACRGRDTLPLMLGGVACASLCLGLVVLGVRSASMVLWCVFVSTATSGALAYSILPRRYPKTMVGRVNTALNVVVFTGMFLGQWGVGAILNLWPVSATGYAPQGYVWALGALWTVQFVGLVWLWRGRRLFAARA